MSSDLCFECANRAVFEQTSRCPLCLNQVIAISLHTGEDKNEVREVPERQQVMERQDLVEQAIAALEEPLFVH
jgi:hypothetical protein